jgi:hypothetical protein
MSTNAEARPAPEPVVSSLIAALAGLPVGLMTVTMEYGLAAVACVASTAAEVTAVCRSRASADELRSDDAEVIVLRGDGATGRRT